ncbi:protein SMG7L-like isoform X2 [Durio zibethinus]|uniref:Protein SMG7L-like isoform X2 n=1 Tax=Durio zibethinus TaxID=66656 RepID=A0A6P5X790_DURZI|nr:protein SMG7L-like isoform X2 [Durio zibethinus]
MNTTLPVPLKDQKEKANFLLEIASTEKQLWALIHSKGLLHSDVRDLYHKVSLSYESFILNDHELTELQDVEYSLWKLHYKHIDEFRNRIKRSSANSESTASAMACSGSDDKHIEGFKSILLKATEFYKKLVVKIRSHYGLPEESSLFKRGGVTASVEPTKLQKCHFLCHRFLVCLGDVARYMEQFEKSNVQKHNWSVAATYYLEAAIIWPDSGNPQNQLAVLATYVGDEFLALYHCVRSLAVKEPFPDAWNNLILLFERNRSCHLHSLSSAARFDFLKPSERSDTQLKSQSSSNISDCCPLKGEHDHSAEKNFWPLLIRTLSFFFLKSRCLQANLLDTCPLLPTILVFVEWLMSILDEVEAYVLDDKTKSSMSYFFAAFIDLLKQLNGRVEVLSHERTALWEDYELRGFAPLAQIHVSLDFSTNWDQIDSYESGIEYRIKRIINAAMKIANRSNGSYKWITYDSLGMKFYAKDTNVIPERPESGKVESTNSDVCVKGLHQHISEATKECETQIANENLSNHAVDGKSVAMEEEEVILFEPLTRYNSAPLNVKINNAKGPASPNEREETVPSDECLRRATSLLIAQNQAHGDTSYFHSDISNYRCSKPFMQQEPLVKDTTALSFSEVPISAGPPSLSAWVLNRGILSSPEKGRSDVSIQGLSPVEEIATSSLSDLSIREIEYSVTSSRSEAPTNHYSPPYSAPAPSAPLLPYDAAWFNSTQSSFSDGKGSGYVNKPENFYDASRVSGYHNWSPDGQLNYGSSIPGFMDKYPPFSGMTSSEWLRQYREKRNLDRANSHMWPINYYAPGHLRNFPTPDASGFGLFDQHGVPCVSNPTIYTESSILHPGFPLVYGLEEPRREKLFHGYQRPSPYGCGAVTETRDQQQPLLWYLKEEEWLLQQDPTLRNPTYMGN